MTVDPKEFQRLISEGYYWDALGIKADTPASEITTEVLKLRLEHPSLGNELNRLQTVLTQKAELYVYACTVRDQISNFLARRYSPEILELEGQAAGKSLSLRADLWHQLSEVMLGPAKADSQTFSNFIQIGTRFKTGIDQAVAHMTSLPITYPAFRQREIKFQMTKQDCKICGGTRQMTCPKCSGSGHLSKMEAVPARLDEKTLSKLPQNLVDYLLDLPESQRNSILNQYPGLLSKPSEPSEPRWTTVTCGECHGKGKLRCQCVMDATVKMPKSIKRGQVISFYAKPLKGPPEKTFARLDYSPVKWVSDSLRYNLLKALVFLHPWTDSGQFVLLVAGSLIMLDVFRILGTLRFFAVLKAGFQGVGQSWGMLSALGKSSASTASAGMDLTAAYGMLLIQAVVYLYIAVGIFLGKRARESSGTHTYTFIDDVIFAVLLITQVLASRWVLLLLSLLLGVVGFSSLVAATFLRNFEMGLAGFYSLVTGITGLILIKKTFSQN